MPNVIIEVSHDHLISQPDNLLARVNDTLWQSGNFKLQSDIKSRIYYPNHALVGLTDSGDEAFVMAHFYLMPGRDDATIQSLAQRIADAIKAHLQEFKSEVPAGNLQICVNSTTLSANYVKQYVEYK